MKIYIIRQQGAMWHEIFLVSRSRQKAVGSCNEMALNDVDSYHDWVVTEFDTREEPKIEVPKFDGECKCDGYGVDVYKTNKDEQMSIRLSG